MNAFSHVHIAPGHNRPQLPQLSEPRRAEPGEWPKFEAALAVVNRDVTATLPGQDALILMVAPSVQPLPPNWIDRDHVYVAMPDGRWQGNAVNADLEEDDPPEPDDAMTALTLVADAAQETLADLLWQAWPICREHSIGMHVRPAGTTATWSGAEADASTPAVWWCRGNHDSPCHDVSPVGELAGTLPEQERRAPSATPLPASPPRTARRPRSG